MAKWYLQHLPHQAIWILTSMEGQHPLWSWLRKKRGRNLVSDTVCIIYIYIYLSTIFHLLCKSDMIYYKYIYKAFWKIGEKFIIMLLYWGGSKSTEKLTECTQLVPSLQHIVINLLVRNAFHSQKINNNIVMKPIEHTLLHHSPPFILHYLWSRLCSELFISINTYTLLLYWRWHKSLNIIMLYASELGVQMQTLSFWTLLLEVSNSWRLFQFLDSNLGIFCFDWRFVFMASWSCCK